MINKMSSVGAPTRTMITQVGTAPLSGAGGGADSCSLSADADGEVTGGRLAKHAK
jgi:hypothetical protein